MIFQCVLTDGDIPRIVRSLRLMECWKGDRVYWSSSSYSVLSGIHAVIENHKLKLSCSIHKLYSQALTGRLDNSRLCTMSDAVLVIRALFGSAGEGLDIPLDRITVKYAEIGLSIKMSHSADNYIRQIISIESVGNRKELFIDYLYEKNRQKVTAKTRNVRKCLKIYDKTFEAAEKDRIVEPDILRVETQYKRMKMPLAEFISPSNLQRILEVYYRDWTSITWQRRVIGTKGVKSSQLDKAKELIELGKDEYLAKYRQEWKQGMLSDKAWRTYREFAMNWESLKSLFLFAPGPLETEFNDRFHRVYVAGKK